MSATPGGSESERKLLALIGLGVRGGRAVVGVEQVRVAAKRGKVLFAVVAPDASRNSLDKVVPLLRARQIRFVEGPPAARLGAAVGREATTVVGITDPELARGLRAVAGSSPDGAQ